MTAFPLHGCLVKGIVWVVFFYTKLSFASGSSFIYWTHMTLVCIFFSSSICFPKMLNYSFNKLATVSLSCLCIYLALASSFAKRSHHSLSVFIFLSTGMAPEVWLPPTCRPQNVSAAFCPSHAVRYRCHAAPLRPQCHRNSGQQHYRVSHKPCYEG